MKQFRGSLLIALLVLILAEMVWSWRKDKKLYNVKEILSNLFIWAGFQLSKLLFAGYQFALLGWTANYAPLTWWRNAWTFVVCFVLADFMYFHLIHHSGMTMNLAMAHRLNWFGALGSPLFFVPLALFDLPPDFIVTAYAINLLYQFFLHTDAVGKFGIVEHFIDTPSAHRMHHGNNPPYLDKSFGGVMIIWDKLFGTYQPDTQKVTYGLTTGFISYNPFTLVFKGFIDLSLANIFSTNKNKQI